MSRTKMVSTWLAPEETQAIDAMAARMGVTRSDIIRWAVGAWADRMIDGHHEIPPPNWARQITLYIASLTKSENMEV